MTYNVFSGTLNPTQSFKLLLGLNLHTEKKGKGRKERVFI